VAVTNIQAAAAGVTSRVCAEVDGAPLWFESDDAPLRPQAEAFGCATLPVAVERRADLVIDAPLDTIWCAQVRALQCVWRQWWRIRRAGLHCRAEIRQPFAKAPGVALCFGGGVDSFYTLLRSGFAFDHLVFVQGYDVKLADSRRAAAAERSLRDVAAAVGAKAVVVRTNLREHPTFRSADWERGHGGALAAVGHLLCPTIGTLVISASYPYYHDVPWGSHWRIDPLWSASQIEIVHYGGWLWRTEKIEAIAGEDLVRRYLRVCWEGRGAEGNCSHCEKCLRTMLVLAEAKQLEHFPVFEGGAALVERINELPFLSPIYFLNYEGNLARSSDPRVAAALRALLERSRANVPTKGRTAARLLRRIPAALGRRARRWGISCGPAPGGPS